MMKKLFSIAILALFGLACTLNGADASHYRPLSVMVNKPVGEEVLVDETTSEPAGKMEEAQEENLEKPASDPVTPALGDDAFDGVWESCGCETSCCEETRSCCCVRRPCCCVPRSCCCVPRSCCCVRRHCWPRRWWRQMMRCCCAPAPMEITETGTGCGCGE